MGEPRDYAAWLEVGDGVDKVNEAAAEVRHKSIGHLVAASKHDGYVVQVPPRRYRRWGSVAEWRRGRG